MNIVTEFLDKWSMMLDDKKAIKNFRDEMLGLMVAVQFDSAVHDDVEEAIYLETGREDEGEV